MADLDDSSRITWRTLRSFARVVRAFTRSTPPVLGPSSFARISAMDLGDLPPGGLFRTSDSHGMAYRRHSPAGTTRANFAVVLVHGAGCFGDQLHAMAAAMAARCFCDVYTLDMRGHGLSEGERGRAVKRPSDMVRDIAEFVSALRARPDAPRVVVGGHSAGGGLVLALARSQAAANVAGYLFIAPFLGLGSGVERPHFGGWVALRRWRLRFLAGINLFGITLFNGAAVVDFNVAPAAPDRRYVPHWSFSTLLAFGPGVWPKAQQPIDSFKPVLVIAGSGDECFEQSRYEGAFASIAPHAQIPEIGPAGHWDVLVDPTALAETTRWLRTFLEVSLPKAFLPPAPSPTAATDNAAGVPPTPRTRQWRTRGARAGVTAFLVLLSQGHAHAQQATPSSSPVSSSPSLLADKAYVRVGVAGIIFEPDASVFRIQGQKVPGAQLGNSSNVTLSGEVGYYVLPHVSLSVTGGLPPKTHVTGEGAIAAGGLLGSARYGTVVGLADYHFNLSGRLQPWIGAGPAALVILSTEGATIQNLKVGNRVGAAVQIGANYMISPHWGVFASATQNFVGSEAKGSYGPYSAETKFTLDPFALQAGLEFRF